MTQPRLFDIEPTPRKYHDSITATVNAKGCMDVDTVKGCTPGMSAKEGGCYGECYAAKIAVRYGIEFETSVVRGFVDRWQHRDILVRQLRAHYLPWYRIGVMGDPSFDWDHTLAVIRNLRPAVGTASYWARGLGNPESFQTCQHGAGRAMGRGVARRAITLDAMKADLASAGTTVYTPDLDAVRDEAPGAYKDVDAVMAASTDLIKVVKKLRPLGTVKG